MKFRSFTLIEVLIVISIIGVLTTIVVVSYRGVQKKSRDDRRVADLSTIASALDQYYENNANKYPLFLGAEGCPEGADPNQAGRIFTERDAFVAKVSDYLNPVPKDPTKDVGYRYVYSCDGRHFALITIIEDQNKSNWSNTAPQYLKYYVGVDPGNIDTSKIYYIAR